MFILNEKIKVQIMLLVLFIVNLSWFSIFKFHTIMGDDLNSWLYYSDHPNFWQYTFVQSFMDKYRPIFNAIEFVLFKMFGLNYAPYYYTNILVNFVIVCLFFHIVKLVTKNIYLSALFSLLFITARFSYYNITQLTGIMEAAALLLFLLIVYYSILFYRDNDTKNLGWILFYYLLTVFTHERFLVLIVFIATLILFSKLDRIRKGVFIAISFVPFIFNMLIKKLVFNASVTMGTSNTEVGFNLQSISKLVGSGIANMFGFNVGPEYLGGRPFLQSIISVQVISVLIAIVVLGLIVIYAWNKHNKKNMIVLILALVLIGSLIFVSSITIRQDFRWLYAPYAAVLIFLAYATQSIRKNIVKYAIVLLFVLLTLRNDHYYRGYMINEFFNYSQIISDSAYDETIKKYGQHISDYTIYIEKHSDINWPLLGDELFKVYSGNDKVKANYVDHLPSSKSDKDIFLRLDWATKKMVSIAEK